ncbi:MAG: ribose-phosphate pyrophosphokinase [Anaerolineales bacterium]|nr:ribose-phosphate pyrophosphokinase [Anaerolineales bacterium]
MASYNGIKLFAGRGSVDLAAAISKYIRIPLSGHDVMDFPNENVFLRLHSSVRGQDVYIIQTTSSPVNRNFMELLITLRTLKQDSADRVTAVVPYLCYTRSDKKDQPRVAITARLIADLIEAAGADRYIFLDLHAGQIQGFFSVRGDVLTTFPILSGYFSKKKKKMHEPVIVTADLGFAKKGRNFAASLGCSMAFIEKRRKGNKSLTEVLTVVGDVEDHDVVIVDDEIDTGGTICQAVKTVKEFGARDVYLSFVHPVLSGPAVERLAGLPVREFVTTDTIPIPAEKKALLGNRLVVLSVAPLLGEVIRRTHEGRSVGELFHE